MIIANSQITMKAQREYREEWQVQEQLQWLRPERQAPLPVAEQSPAAVKVDLSAAGSLLARNRQVQSLRLDAELDPRSRLNLMILQAIFREVTGGALVVQESSKAAAESGVAQLSLEAGPPGVLAAGAGVVYQRHERYSERESLAFQAQGVIRTQDGKEIAFSVSLAMSREYVRESSLQVRTGNAVMTDPLVINFDGKGAELSQTRFAFDLDNDGSAEQIAMLRPGSGYLALDRNGDGEINNGSELFGPSSGRGFAELAAFDEDGNQFIDEGDSIYHQLRIWMMNDDGSSQLIALGDAGIGAIYIGHISSPFQLKDSNNGSLGEVANTGIYVNKNGTVGLVQEVNLSV